MGNGRGKKPLFPDLESPAIAHNELAASAGFGAFGARARDFPGNRAPGRKEFILPPKKENRLL
jgi:hypothetical protein